MLLPVCFGNQETRKYIFNGKTPRSHMDYSICHLNEHLDKPLKIGVTFEVIISELLWIVDYDVSICCSQSDDDKSTGFLSEYLAAISSIF